jgi:hypothetical protein
MKGRLCQINKKNSFARQFHIKSLVKPIKTQKNDLNVEINGAPAVRQF